MFWSVIWDGTSVANHISGVWLEPPQTTQQATPPVPRPPPSILRKSDRNGWRGCDSDKFLQLFSFLLQVLSFCLKLLEAQAVTLSFSGFYSALSVACRETLLVSQALHLNLNKRPLISPSWSHVTVWLQNNAALKTLDSHRAIQIIKHTSHSETNLNSEQSVWLEVKMTPKLTTAAFLIHSWCLKFKTLCQFHPKIEQTSFKLYVSHTHYLPKITTHEAYHAFLWWAVLSTYYLHMHIYRNVILVCLLVLKTTKKPEVFSENEYRGCCINKIACFNLICKK